MTITLDHILCPVDFSKNSELALDYAGALARSHDAKLTILHVLFDVAADGYPYIPESIYPNEETRTRAAEELQTFAASVLGSDPPATLELGEGQVVDVVVAKADELGVDMIVVGTEGRRGVSRLLLGSVTERLLRQAHRPVLSVSPSAALASEKRLVFDNILCPVDFSPESLEAYRYSLALLGEGATVTLFHAVEMVADAALGDAVGFDVVALRQQHREDALKKLHDAVPEGASSRTRVEVEMVSSTNAYREILARAKGDEHDLIVMGVGARSTADLFFFGSTANHVVRQATCPVLTVTALERSVKALPG